MIGNCLFVIICDSRVQKWDDTCITYQKSPPFTSLVFSFVNDEDHIKETKIKTMLDITNKTLVEWDTC